MMTRAYGADGSTGACHEFMFERVREVLLQS